MIYFPWLSKRITFQTDHYFCPSHPFLWEIPLHPFPIRFFSSSLILLHFCCRASLASVPTMDDVQIILDILQWHPAPSSVSAQGAGHTPLPNLCRLHIGMAPCRSCFDPGEAEAGAARARFGVCPRTRALPAPQRLVRCRRRKAGYDQTSKIIDQIQFHKIRTHTTPANNGED